MNDRTCRRLISSPPVQVDGDVERDEAGAIVHGGFEQLMVKWRQGRRPCFVQPVNLLLSVASKLALGNQIIPEVCV